MTTWTREQIEDAWKQAEEQPIGVTIRTDAPVLLQNELAEVRLELKRPELFEFSIHVSSDRVWIMRRAGPVQTEGEYEPMEE